MMIEAAHLFINNLTKPTSFHSPTVYMFVERLLKELWAVYE